MVEELCPADPENCQRFLISSKRPEPNLLCLKQVGCLWDRDHQKMLICRVQSPAGCAWGPSLRTYCVYWQNPLAKYIVSGLKLQYLECLTATFNSKTGHASKEHRLLLSVHGEEIVLDSSQILVFTI